MEKVWYGYEFSLSKGNGKWSKWELDPDWEFKKNKLDKAREQIREWSQEQKGITRYRIVKVTETREEAK
jgi:hypothetical protein